MAPRTFLALALIGTLLGTEAFAARPSPGRYSGKVDGASLSFRVKAGKIRALQFGRIVARCDDGTTRGVRVRPLPARWSVAIRRGRFRESTALGNAERLGTVTFAGRFASRTRVRGTLRHDFLHVPTGARCDTGTLAFSARRRGAPAPGGPVRILSGTTENGGTLSLAVTAAGDGVRPARMVTAMACGDGGSVTLDVRNPPGGNAAVTPTRTFSALWKFVPPAVAGRAAPSGGAIELSGRVTDTGLEGAARMSIGFEDGSSCDSGWQLFTIAGPTAVG